MLRDSGPAKHPSPGNRQAPAKCLALLALHSARRFIQHFLNLRIFCLPLLLCLCAAPLHAAEPPAAPALRIGLTPVFLDDQISFLNQWRDYLERQLGQPVAFVQRSSYREVVEMLRERQLDFAWLCGYPYVRNRDFMRLVAVPLYQGEPLYQSYLIVPAANKQTRSLTDLQHKNFAFSDPDSNSGHLYTEYLLSLRNEKPASFFGRTFYTWSHRKVVEAVAAGLADGGAVDGYVWETLALSHPELTAQTRIVDKSRKFGHPPIIAGPAASSGQISELQRVLFGMSRDKAGAGLLRTLNLDGFVPGEAALFDDIEEMSRKIDMQP